LSTLAGGTSARQEGISEAAAKKRAAHRLGVGTDGKTGKGRRRAKANVPDIRFVLGVVTMRRPQ